MIYMDGFTKKEEAKIKNILGDEEYNIVGLRKLNEIAIDVELDSGFYIVKTLEEIRKFVHEQTEPFRYKDLNEYIDKML